MYRNENNYDYETLNDELLEATNSYCVAEIIDTMTTEELNAVREYIKDREITVGYASIKHQMELTEDSSCLSLLRDYLRLIAIDYLCDGQIVEARKALNALSY